jgi:hypothetical protein
MLRNSIGADSLWRVRQQELRLTRSLLVLGAKYAAGGAHEVVGVSRYSMMSSCSSAERSRRDGMAQISRIGGLAVV